MISINFNLTSSDFIRFQKHAISRLNSTKKQKWSHQILSTAFWALILIFAFAQLAFIGNKRIILGTWNIALMKKVTIVWEESLTVY